MLVPVIVLLSLLERVKPIIAKCILEPMLGGAGIGGEQLVAIGVNGAEVLGEFERAFVNLEAKVTLVPRDNSGIVGGKKRNRY